MLKKIICILIIVPLMSCTVTSTGPDKVDSADANTVLTTDLGVVIDVVPVRIKGAPSTVGAIAGGIIGGIAAEKIGSGSGQDIAIVAGTVAGGIVGFYSTTVLGEHNGFQLTIKIDDVEKPVTIIQGVSKDQNKNYKTGDRVTIIYGNKVKVLPSRNFKSR